MLLNISAFIQCTGSRQRSVSQELWAFTLRAQSETKGRNRIDEIGCSPRQIRFSFGVSLHTAVPIWAQGEHPVTENGPDQELKELRLDDLEARLPTMEQGHERDYFAGVLANRAGHVQESIELLKSSLSSIRTSRPDRAAVALQALADDYTKSFQYGDAAQVYEDLLTHFATQLAPEELKGTQDDAGVAQIYAMRRHRLLHGMEQ